MPLGCPLLLTVVVCRVVRVICSMSLASLDLVSVEGGAIECHLRWLPPVSDRSPGLPTAGCGTPAVRSWRVVGCHGLSWGPSRSDVLRKSVTFGVPTSCQTGLLDR